MTKRTGLFGMGALALLLMAGAALAAGMMMNRSMARHHQGMMVGAQEPYRGIAEP